MTKLAIIATMQIEPGQADKVLPLLMAHRDRCLSSEPGTLKFEIMRPHDHANQVMLYEVYESQATFEEHWIGPSMAQIRTETAGALSLVSGVKGIPLD